MSLFSNSNRNSTAPSGYAAGIYDYLDSSVSRDAQRVRKHVNRMWRNVPRDGKSDLKSRFKSSNDRHHLAAFLEIYICYLLKRLGYCVKTHPALDHTDRRPDFYARRLFASDLILEATTASHRSLQEEAAKKRANIVYDVINKMNSPDFWLHISAEGVPDTPPKASRLRSELEGWLSALSWSDLSQLVDKGEEAKLPVFHYEYEGWAVEFKAWPKSLQKRGTPGIRPIGVQVGSFKKSTATEAIQDSVLDKSSAYGTLSLPYVVAVNSRGPHTSESDVIDALFGTVSYMISSDRDAGPLGHRNRDGALLGESGPINQQVSAVMIVNSLSPWRLSYSKPLLYLNPWAAMKLQGPIMNLSYVEIIDGTPSKTGGLDHHKLLGIYPGWPE